MSRRRAVRSAIVLASVLMVVFLSGCDWTTYFQGSKRAGWGVYEPALNAASAPSLSKKWQTSDSGPDHGVFSQAIVAGGKVYWGSFDGYERATDTAGHLVWKTFLGTTSPPACTEPSEAGVVSTPTVVTDTSTGTSVMYVGGGDSKMYALNALTGAVLWSTPVGSKPDHFVWSSPLVNGNNVYIGVSSFGDCPLVQGQLLELDKSTGAIKHTFNVVPNGCTGGGVWGSPTLDTSAGTLYFTTGNGGACGSSEPLAPAIVEVHASDLTLVGSWAVPPNQQGGDSDFGSTPTLFTGVIGGQQRNLVGAINKNGIYYTLGRDALASGPLWSRRIGGGGDDPISGTGDVASSAYDGTKLYVGGGFIQTSPTSSCNGTVNALNPSTGALVWSDCFQDGNPLGGVSGVNDVVTFGEGNNLVVVSAATGATLFTFAGAGLFWAPPSIANGTLYEGDMSGNLYALAPH